MKRKILFQAAAVVAIPDNVSYVRIEIEDINGKKAWTNAYSAGVV